MTGTVGVERPAVEVAEVIRESRRGVPGQARRRLTGAQRQALRDLARVPHRGAGRARRALPRLRPRPHRLQLVPQPPLSEVPGLGPRPLAGTRGRSILLPVEYSPRGVHAAGGDGRIGAGQPGGAVRRCCSQAASATLREVAANPKRLGASGRRADGAAHLGPEPAPSSARALRRHRRRPVVRRQATESMRRRRWVVVPARLLPAGACAQPRVPRQVSAPACVGSPPTASSRLPGRLRLAIRRRSHRCWRTSCTPRTGWSTPSGRSAGPDAGAEVPGPLHPSRGHQQLAARRRRRRPGDVPLQGLRRRPPVEDDDAFGARSSCVASCSTCCRRGS